MERFAKGLDLESTNGLVQLLPPEFGRELLKAFGPLLRRIQLSIVADASALISLLVDFLHSRPSRLWDLVRDGYIKCWAPLQLERDLEGKFERLAERFATTVDHVQYVWDTQIAPYVRLDFADAPGEVQDRLASIRSRDPEDVEYVSLAITIGADGVFSTDPHLLKEGEVRVITFREACRIVSVYRRGRLATTVQINVSLTGAVLGGAFISGVVALGKALVRLAKRVGPGVWIGIGAGVLLAGGVLLAVPQTREWIVKKCASVKDSVASVWSSIHGGLGEIGKVWAPVLDQLLRAQEEAGSLLREEPIFKKRRTRPRRYPRIFLSLKITLVEVLKKSPNPMRPIEIVRTLARRTSSCDLSRLRRTVSRVLASDPEFVRVSRGRYALASASGGAQ